MDYTIKLPDELSDYLNKLNRNWLPDNLDYTNIIDSLMDACEKTQIFYNKDCRIRMSRLTYKYLEAIKDDGSFRINYHQCDNDNNIVVMSGKWRFFDLIVNNNLPDGLINIEII